jgi:hypothetical protein
MNSVVEEQFGFGTMVITEKYKEPSLREVSAEQRQNAIESESQ